MLDIHSLKKTITFTHQGLSLLMVEPRPAFLSWLESFANRTGLSKYNYYSEEENITLAIPHVSRFSEPGSLDELKARLKPALLQAELARFGASESELGHAISADTFDLFFSIHVRDTCLHLQDFGL